MLLVMFFIPFDGEVALKNINIEKASAVRVEYSFQDTCTLHMRFMKGYDVYQVSRKITKNRGVVEFSLDEARLIPTRRKPVSIPPMLSGNCTGRVEKVEVR